MSKSRSAVLISLLLVIAVCGGLLLGLNGASGSGSGDGTPSSDEQPPATPPAGQPEVQPAAQPEPAPQPTVPTTQPQPKPNPGVLAVGPSVIDLAENQWTAKFTVANVGGSDLAWFAVGVPSTVSLSETKGVLAAGAETTVTATVDHTMLAKGPFSLTLHVSANDTAQSVTIKGTKTIKVTVPLGPNVIKPNS